MYLPLCDKILPGRLVMYTWLGLALLVAIRLSSRAASAIGLVIAAGIVVTLLPNPAAKYWISGVDTPPFFRNGIYRRYLSQNETVMVMPYGATGNSLLWQAETSMDFRNDCGICRGTPGLVRRNGSGRLSGTPRRSRRPATPM
jgi:hypothetical protein